jgi:hypothetical protein
MARNQHYSWTPEIDQQIREMLLKGKSVHAIAVQLKRTVGAIKSRAQILGLSIAMNKTVRDQRNGRETPVDLQKG